MNRKLTIWIAAAALGLLPALTFAAPEAPEAEENEAWDSAPGHGPMAPGMERPGNGPGMDKNMRAGEDGDEEDAGRKTAGKRKGLGFQGRPGMEGPGVLTSDEIMATVKKYDAAFAKKLEDYKASAPAKYRVILQMAGKQLFFARMENDAEAEKDSVRVIALEFEVKEMARRYDKAADADKAGIKTELKARLSELFDIRAKGQEARVARMERDLAKLKKGMVNRKANKAKIVDQRADELTGEGLGW